MLKRRHVSGHTDYAAVILADHSEEAASEDSTRRMVDWFSEWRKPLRRFVAGRHVIPPRDLDDVAQEVFLRLMRYDRAELVENPQAYLFKMAANVAAEWAIRSRNNSARDLAWLESGTADDTSDGEMTRLEAEEEIAEALRGLRPRQREVLKLQFFEGLSHAQTARRLGITERVVKRTLAKSYQRLRRELVPPYT